MHHHAMLLILANKHFSRKRGSQVGLVQLYLSFAPLLGHSFLHVCVCVFILYFVL